MAKNTNTNDFSIVSIDPVSLQAYSYYKNSVSFFNINKASSKKEFYTSYLYTKDIISGIVEVSRRLDDDEIPEAVEIEAYEALGLDSAVEYKLIHLEAETSDGKNRAYNVFAFDSELISRTFQDIRDKTRYIDYITAAPFLFESLYNKKMLEPDGLDCFIYLQKNDAFLTIYQNGKYLYSKSLNYSLLQINEKFCELLGERIDEEAFYNTLAVEGLETENEVYRQYLLQLFGEIFNYINDVIIFFKRSYSVDDIDRIYIGSEIGSINGIIEHSENYLGITTNHLLFNIAKNRDEHYIDQMHILMQLSVQDYMENKEENINLTIFKRPPAFLKRPSGLLTIGSIFALIATLAYPVYQYAYGVYFRIDSVSKQDEYTTVHDKANSLRSRLGRLERQNKAVLNEIKKYDKKLEFRKKIINEIHEKKVNYPMKGVILDDLAKLINNRDIKVHRVLSSDHNTTISLRSSSNKKLTELLSDIAETEKYNVITKEIIKQDDSLVYESNITTKVTR